MLVVERLSDARRLSHDVLAVVRGSAINQDGASNGLTAPSGSAQQRVIRQALANGAALGRRRRRGRGARHGTALGDPVEAGALLATYGRDRAHPLLLGSLKSNVGHTQAAAGLAGVLKMVLALQHGVLPATLHVEEPSPLVDWTAGMRLLTEATRGRTGAGPAGPVCRPSASAAPTPTSSWSRRRQRRPVRRDRARRRPAWVLSGAPSRRCARAPPSCVPRRRPRTVGPAAVGGALATTRAAFDHRTVILGAGPRTSRRRLAAIADDLPDPAVVRGVTRGPAKIVFVFPGQGSQWPEMARELLEHSPVFAEQAQRCDAALRPYVDWSVVDVLRGVGGAPDMSDVDVVQPPCSPRWSRWPRCGAPTGCSRGGGRPLPGGDRRRVRRRRADAGRRRPRRRPAQPGVVGAARRGRDGVRVAAVGRGRAGRTAAGRLAVPRSTRGRRSWCPVPGSAGRAAGR
jgi:hypothetical protein